MITRDRIIELLAVSSGRTLKDTKAVYSAMTPAQWVELEFFVALVVGERGGCRKEAPFDT